MAGARVRGANGCVGSVAEEARGAVTEAMRGGATLRELVSGYALTIVGKAARKVRQAASAAKRAWAASLRKIFGLASLGFISSSSRVS